MTDYADTRALEFASMIDEKQRYVAIYAYGDQRAREVLERAAQIVREAAPSAEFLACLILEIIPKNPAND